MDIISYSKAKKATVAIKNVNKRLGHNEQFKHGDKDIKGNFDSTDKRIQAIELETAPALLNRRVSELTAHTMVNLNKHNLKVKTFLGVTHYALKNHLFDDFADNKSISFTESTNIQYNSTLKRIELVSGKTSGTVVFLPVSVGKPIDSLALSFEGEGISYKTINVPLDDSCKYNQFDRTAKMIEIIEKVKDSNNNEVNIYKDSATIETPIIFIGDDISGIYSLSVTNNIDVFLADSLDGKIFSDYKKAVFPLECKPYIRLKIVLNPIEGIIELPADVDFTDNSNGHFVGELTSNLAPILKRKFDIDIDSETTVNNNGIIVNSITMQMWTQPYLRRQFNIQKDLEIEESDIEDIESIYSVYLQNAYKLI